MLKKFIKNTKRYVHIIVLVFIIYILVILSLTVFYLDNPQLVFSNMTYEDVFEKYGAIIPPLDQGGTGGSTEVTGSTNIFDAQVILMSNTERQTDYNLHMFALPGQYAQIFRDFSVYIFSNQNASYIVKMDNQTISEGKTSWMKIIKSRSEYDEMDITVILSNSTHVERKFEFNAIQLMDSPWQVNPSGGGGTQNNNIPEIVKPYIEMSQGELNTFIIKRVVADIISVIAGIIIGIQFAVIKADLRGVERMF